MKLPSNFQIYISKAEKSRRRAEKTLLSRRWKLRGKSGEIRPASYQQVNFSRHCAVLSGEIWRFNCILQVTGKLRIRIGDFWLLIFPRIRFTVFWLLIEGDGKTSLPHQMTKKSLKNSSKLKIFSAAGEVTKNS